LLGGKTMAPAVGQPERPYLRLYILGEEIEIWKHKEVYYLFVQKSKFVLKISITNAFRIIGKNNINCLNRSLYLNFLASSPLEKLAASPPPPS
jgi:hypothetical protein